MRKCKVCKTPYQPRNSLQKVCSPPCAIAAVKEQKAKAWRKEKRKRKEQLKSKRELLRDAQKEFNAYIRARDHAEPCISCGRFHQGQWHAGHYRTTAAAPQLRFNEDNCHKQCQPCNTHLSGNLVEYRIRLKEKIGAERLQALETNNDLARWTRDEIREIRDHYRQKLKLIKSTNVRS